MRDLIEPSGDTFRIARKVSQKPDFCGGGPGGPIRVEWSPAIDYRDMAAYIRAWPDKLTAFVVQRLADDDMSFFTRELYEYICQSDADGPAFEEWRST